MARSNGERAVQDDTHLIWIDGRSVGVIGPLPSPRQVGVERVGQRADPEGDEAAVAGMQVRCRGFGARGEIDADGWAAISRVRRRILLKHAGLDVLQPEQVVAKPLPAFERGRIGPLEAHPGLDAQALRQISESGEIVVVQVDDRDSKAPVGIEPGLGESGASDQGCPVKQFERSFCNGAGA